MTNKQLMEKLQKEDPNKEVRVEIQQEDGGDDWVEDHVIKGINHSVEWDYILLTV